MPETSICQLSYFGCCYFSLEIAGFMLTQRASKQKPCVDLQESDAVWKAAIRYCLVTANIAWNRSVVIYEFATWEQKCTREVLLVYMFRWRAKASMSLAIKLEQTCLLLFKWSSALSSASVPLWCSPVCLLKSCRSHQMCYDVHGNAGL